jgi:valyl-tRNA synthetase
MTGHEVLFPLGLDRNGLPIEVAAEKKFKKKFNEVPREEFLEMCRTVLEEASNTSMDTFAKLGISFNSWTEGSDVGEVYLTDSAEYRALTQATFIDLWEKELIYEDERVNNYCPGCETTIADSEIDYEEIPTKFSDIKWKVQETEEEIVIGTTRPEFLASCAMVLYNPADERYQHLEGKHAVVPLFDRVVPIKAHPYAQIDKGTGLVMMCSFGDYTDVRFFREQKLEPIILIDKKGFMTEKSGFLKGLKVKEAREKVLETLKEKDLIVEQTTIQHRTPVCDRSKDPIEFIGMKEFYLKQVDFLDDLRKISDRIDFYNPKSKKILDSWIDNVSIDWPISRRRYYATEVPLWYCTSCKAPVLGERGKYVQPWKDNAPVDKCPKCGHNGFEGETRVFDTWFDSSITPLHIMKWGSDDEFFKKHKPCTLRPQGKEIVRTWLYYTLLKCYHLTNDPIFHDVWIHHHIVDEKGNKMSKSVGNVIDPQEVIEKYGAEALRLWVAVEGNIINTDLRCSYDRVEGAGKTLTKLWNVARFVSMFPEAGEEKELNNLDKFILGEADKLVESAKENYAKYDFHVPTLMVRNFIWETFASHYLELCKNRAYNQEGKYTKAQQNGALYTLNYCLNTVLKLLAPVVPIITQKLYKDLHETDIHQESFPEVGEAYEVPFTKEQLMELNSTIWKAKQDNKISLRAEIAELTMPEEFKSIEQELKATHNAQNIKYGEKVEVKI